MAKQKTCQRYIYKIHSGRLRRAKWDLTLPLTEARRNDEVVSLADNQVLRWLDELNGIEEADGKALEIRRQIRALRSEENKVQNKRKIKTLYTRLDQIQFKPDYFYLVIDKEKDYRRACRGFRVNGVKYLRLLGTNGGVKNSTIVFCAERHIEEIRRRIDNGRDKSKELVPAKLEAYRALTCSASSPVSMPRGVLVVRDCETTFPSDVTYLNDDADGEPVMEERLGESITLDESDGYGLMLPALAERWSKELGLDYTVSGVNTRFAWEKGMVFPFDFVDFAQRVAGTYRVKDAWGDEVDVRNVELILTTSMVKLWDSYPSCEEYLRHCRENRYSFCVTKICPRELETERTLNYQFIQPYNLNGEDLERLIRPTMEELREVLGADASKTALFLRGMEMNDENVLRGANDYAKAILVEPDMMNDPYVRGKVYQAIKNRINDAKVGALKVHGNYSIVCADPYALCQSIFEMDVTGLLRDGELYNRYWCEHDAEKLACFRAPMTSMENIRVLVPHRSGRAAYWYRYMTSCTVFNAFDTCAMAMNGMDYDGDMVMITDNDVLISNHRALPALMCVQRKAAKRAVSEDDLIQSNINSFGDEIGKITNRITSMFAVRSRYKEDSEEYQALSYRIKCGQLYQQNAIDKAKGILAKPMPREWYDRRSAGQIEDPEKREFYLRIIADRKPYFMRLIYPSLMKQYNTYVKNTNKKALREFRMTVDDLREIPEGARTEEQRVFLMCFDRFFPVETGECVMNRICRRFEEEFDHFLCRHNAADTFDYSILKSGAEYSQAQRRAIEKLYETYNRKVASYAMFVNREHVDEFDVYVHMEEMREEFVRECSAVCPNRFVLCDIVLDLCYTREASKRFAWEICGDEILENLLRRNGGVIRYPAADLDGDIVYCGRRFSMKTIRMEEFG